VVLDQLLLARPESAEQALGIATRLTDSQALDLLVIDPAAALTPELERKTAIGESGPGLHGRVLASGLRGLARSAARAGAVVLFLNQARRRLETAAESSAGGPALKLHAGVRIRISPAPPAAMRFRVLKNRDAAAFRGGKLDWIPGHGFVEAP
jgi:RecA/RadA recombinase